MGTSAVFPRHCGLVVFAACVFRFGGTAGEKKGNPGGQSGDSIPISRVLLDAGRGEEWRMVCTAHPTCHWPKASNAGGSGAEPLARTVRLRRKSIRHHRPGAFSGCAPGFRECMTGVAPASRAGRVPGLCFSLLGVPAGRRRTDKNIEPKETKRGQKKEKPDAWLVDGGAMLLLRFFAFFRFFRL